MYSHILVAVQAATATVFPADVWEAFFTLPDIQQE